MEIAALLLLAAMANWQVVETFHHGSLFDTFRAYMEARRDWLGELLTCPFCLSHWTGFVFTAMVVFHLWQPAWRWNDLAVWPLFAFAVIRLSNVLNDACHGFSRTPRDVTEEVKELERLAGEEAMYIRDAKKDWDESTRTTPNV